MFMEFKVTPPRRVFGFLTILTIVLFAACKKADFAQKSSLQNEERFFKLPANARPELKRIVEDLKIKNKIHPFINEFIASEGYPLWEFAQFKKRKFNVTNRGDGNEQDSLVQVPIVQEEAQYVKDILNIRIDSSILYKLIAGEEYASFGFNKDPNRTTPNANDIVGTIMAYEHLIWGQNIFEITDNRLFDNWPQGAPKPDSFYVVQKFTTTYSTITWVCGFHTGGQLQSCPPGVEHCFELIPEICSITWVSTTYEGDGDSGEWVPIPPTITPGSGSGGGTGTNPTTPNPPNNLPTICGSGRGWVRIVPDIETGIWKNPCTGITIPISGQPIIIDTSYLNHIARSVSHQSDSLFNWAFVATNNFREQGAIIVIKNGQIYLKNMKPGTDEGTGSINYNLAPGEELLGYFHTHPVDTDYRLRSFFSDNDFWEFHKNARVIAGYLMFLECGNKRFMAVVEDLQKYRDFMTISKLQQIQKRHIEYMLTPAQSNYYTNGQQASINAAIQFFGSTANCGLGFYETNDPSKTNFIKINP